MANTNTVVKQTYACNGSNHNFAIPFFFIAGEESVIKVYLIDDATQVATLLALTADYTLDSPATTVTTIAAYAVGKSIQVKRVSPKVQTSEFIQGSFPFQSIEDQFDRVVNLVQEVEDNNTGFLALPVGVTNLELPVPTANKLIGWNAGATALENKSESDVPAIQSDLTILTGRVADLEAQDAITIAKDVDQDYRLDMLELNVFQNITDISDLQVSITATGAAMANFPADIANLQSQIDLINDRGADVDALLITTADHTNTLASHTASLLDHAYRISALEAASPLSEYSGSQAIVNNSVAPVALTSMKLDGDGTQLGTFTVQITRKDSLETRITRVILVMLYDVDLNTWYIGRENTTFFTGDTDGLVFSVATDVNKVGQVSYTSDNMIGTGYIGTLKFIGKEIPTGV